MSILTNLLGLYYKSGMRGSWRLSDFLVKHLVSLQRVPIEVDGGILYGDLRIGSARGILASPTSKSGEDKVMYKYVRPGDVVFDIGAHLGFYTLLLSKLAGACGKVFAFEPNPELLASLRMTLSACENVKLFEIALSNESGEIDLFVPEDASMASLADWTDGDSGIVHSVQCKMKVLDEMVGKGEIPIPNFIKCDVEGAELDVFNGARSILDRTDAPIVLFELNRKAGESFARKNNDYLEFFLTLTAANYSFFEVLPEGTRQMQNWNLAYTNVLAVPASRSA